MALSFRSKAGSMITLIAIEGSKGSACNFYMPSHLVMLDMQTTIQPRIKTSDRY